ncbi:MAG: aldose 1-epimerase family protein [Marmoricola sp.]
MTRRWTITGGGHEATVLEAGGGLGTLSRHGEPLVAGPPPGAAVSGGRGQLLLPWPNRIRDGRYSWGGTEHQLPLTEPALHNATHGLARWCAWQLLDHGPSQLEVGLTLVAQTGYPWELALGASYAVDEQGLHIEIWGENRADVPVPFAAGMHPYLDPGAIADEVELTVPAGVHQVTDRQLIPAGTAPTPPERDFRDPRRIGPLELDDAWTDLDRDADGWATVRLRGARTVALHLGPAWRWVQVFTGDTLSSGQRQSIAVEPMSAPANAFASGTDLVTLDPGERWSGSFRIAGE